MTFWEDDLDYFFNDFSITATLASGTSIKVIENVSFTETLGIENVDLEILAKYSDVSALVQNSTVAIGGVTYYVMRAPINDGSGIASIPLSKTQV
jgi:hypothetical protein